MALHPKSVAQWKRELKNAKTYAQADTILDRWNRAAHISLLEEGNIWTSGIAEVEYELHLQEEDDNAE